MKTTQKMYAGAIVTIFILSAGQAAFAAPQNRGGEPLHTPSEKPFIVNTEAVTHAQVEVADSGSQAESLKTEALITEDVIRGQLKALDLEESRNLGAEVRKLVSEARGRKAGFGIEARQKAEALRKAEPGTQTFRDLMAQREAASGEARNMDERLENLQRLSGALQERQTIQGMQAAL